MHGDSVNTYNLRKQIENYADGAAVPVLAGGVRAIIDRLERLEELLPKLRAERDRYLGAAKLLREGLEETIVYASDYFREKWELDEPLKRTAFLDEVKS